MKEIKFQVEGVEGDFFVDADEMKSYKTIKAFALSEKNAAPMFEAMERVFMRHDEEYVDRVGGMDNLSSLIDAAAEAAKAKN